MDDPVPVLHAHLADRLVDRDAGVVDQDVELAVLVQDLGDDPLAVGRDTDVALVDGRALMGGGERLGGVGAVGVADRHPGPPFGEPVADRQADPAGAAGDERDLTVHAGHEEALPPAGGPTG